jgi:toxin YhaV
VIVYAWVNDENTLRKAGSRNVPYSVFHAMLNAGNPPSTMAELLAVSSRLEAAHCSRQQAAVKPGKKRTR